jgi:hypothetical protein
MGFSPGYSESISQNRRAVKSPTKGVMSSDQARRGDKAAVDAALGRGSQALTEWIEGLR